MSRLRRSQNHGSFDVCCWKDQKGIFFGVVAGCYYYMHILEHADTRYRAYKIRDLLIERYNKEGRIQCQPICLWHKRSYERGPDFHYNSDGLLTTYDSLIAARFLKYDISEALIEAAWRENHPLRPPQEVLDEILKRNCRVK